MTASANSNSTTIANDAVTNAKAANMADATIKGRALGAGTGDPTDLTAAQAKAIIAPQLEASVGITIDGGGVAPTTGVKGYVKVPWGMTITSWSLVADTPGDIVIDVWAETGAKPDDTDTITGGSEPELSTDDFVEGGSVAGWSTTLAAGDWVGFNVDSAATVTRVTLQLIGTRV